MNLSTALDWVWARRVFEPHQEIAYEAHEAEGNHSRLRLLLPLMLGAQVLLVVRLAAIGGLRASLPPADLLFRDAITAVYAGSALGSLVLTGLLFRGGPALQRLMPTIASMAYFLHVTAVVGVDQLQHPKAGIFAGACLFIALLVSQSPARIVATYAVGVTGYLAAVVTMQPDLDHRANLLRAGLGTAAFCCALALFLVGARRRDFRKSLVIEEQKAELADLNANLERRVAEQVDALTRRAAEVEQLNAQLQAQVKDRSRALATALRRLAVGDITPNDLEGRLIGDRFSVGSLIASGGMGAVYEGVDTNTGDSVAVKVIRSSGRTPLRLLERFFQEAEAVATVDHPGVVRMLHVDIDEDGTLFQVQELVSGETLADALEQRGRFTIGAAARVLAVLCEALAAAHEQGVVHRDVKPANIMLTRQAPGVKLLDFGISKVVSATGSDELDDPDSTIHDVSEVVQSSEASTDRRATRAGAVMGTPQFMSPEQREDSSRVTDRSDVYAIAVVASLAFTGRLPGVGPPIELGPAADLLAAALEVVPQARPTAAQLAIVLHELADESGTGCVHELVAWGALNRDTTDAAETLMS